MSIKRALISVSDKQNLLPLAQALAQRGVEILSTGGTAKTLRSAGIAVVDVATYTQSPEIMEGRVKTLHPRVHAGILMRERDEDRVQLASIGGRVIDLVVVNLYPFEATIARADVTHDEAVENIDIGGPSMVRAAAKNHNRVTVVVDPLDYSLVISSLDVEGGVPFAVRAQLAAKAFAHTAAYDGAVAAYLTSTDANGKRESYPRTITQQYERAYPLRYGENPHQTGAFYVARNAPEGSLGRAASVGAGGKELSFNNLVDVDAALEAVREFSGPTAVVVKHTNPCGVACANTLVTAYRTARAADELSAFGGIVALNRDVDEATATALVETFLECVVAPGFSQAALQILHQKKNLRLIATGPLRPANEAALTFKALSGGMLVQDRDGSAAGEVEQGKAVSERLPSVQELDALAFAWRVCKHVKSNAIVLARRDEDGTLRTVGVGAGQMSRVVSVELAVKKAADQAAGSVLASDAFFPFADGVEVAARAGIVAIAQPGGSVRDAEVITAANDSQLAMVFTGFRHFRH
ncbi:MAG: bifunctional phosphoribosylaminoimidazolecarboxamide formyltransferase/IMP cyclohydrolase [Deltaproteobacteria bacterium]|nr:bifunctional phosphoribosylaminoimidazolecarboxamide formyltransferase/IMP cyclohydrolase [Deltaproteobacteria bacterium]